MTPKSGRLIYESRRPTVVVILVVVAFAGGVWLAEHNDILTRASIVAFCALVVLLLISFLRHPKWVLRLDDDVLVVNSVTTHSHPWSDIARIDLCRRWIPCPDGSTWAMLLKITTCDGSTYAYPLEPYLDVSAPELKDTLNQHLHARS
jgi:hypothetical protein